MYNSEDYCHNCKWLEDRSDGKFVNSYRCGLYGRGLKYTYCGCEKCDECVDKAVKTVREFSKQLQECTNIPVIVNKRGQDEKPKVIIERIG